ncbi:hypothetical protein BGZ65_003790 [Modicella reniformis]|uniref:Uncharacterized protein n=1 Tax=Modicella reniformis TaxID=1440133 RepID=A0A9P6MHG7_9FUNG|nr:hypothetical protein BGZ65_003790 [Modicella reniformis]
MDQNQQRGRRRGGGRGRGGSNSYANGSNNNNTRSNRARGAQNGSTRGRGRGGQERGRGTLERGRGGQGRGRGQVQDSERGKRRSQKRKRPKKEENNMRDTSSINSDSNQCSDDDDGFVNNYSDDDNGSNYGGTDHSLATSPSVHDCTRTAWRNLGPDTFSSEVPVLLPSERDAVNTLPPERLLQIAEFLEDRKMDLKNKIAEMERSLDILKECDDDLWKQQAPFLLSLLRYSIQILRNLQEIRSVECQYDYYMDSACIAFKWDSQYQKLRRKLDVMKRKTTQSEEEATSQSATHVDITLADLLGQDFLDLLDTAPGTQSNTRPNAQPNAPSKPPAAAQSAQSHTTINGVVRAENTLASTSTARVPLVPTYVTSTTSHHSTASPSSSNLTGDTAKRKAEVSSSQQVYVESRVQGISTASAFPDQTQQRSKTLVVEGSTAAPPASLSAAAPTPATVSTSSQGPFTNSGVIDLTTNSVFGGSVPSTLGLPVTSTLAALASLLTTSGFPTLRPPNATASTSSQLPSSWMAAKPTTTSISNLAGVWNYMPSSSATSSAAYTSAVGSKQPIGLTLPGLAGGSASVLTPKPVFPVSSTTSSLTKPLAATAVTPATAANLTTALTKATGAGMGTGSRALVPTSSAGAVASSGTQLSISREHSVSSNAITTTALLPKPGISQETLMSALLETLLTTSAAPQSTSALNTALSKASDPVASTSINTLTLTTSRTSSKAVEPPQGSLNTLMTGFSATSNTPARLLIPAPIPSAAPTVSVENGRHNAATTSTDSTTFNSTRGTSSFMETSATAPQSRSSTSSTSKTPYERHEERIRVLEKELEWLQMHRDSPLTQSDLKTGTAHQQMDKLSEDMEYLHRQNEKNTKLTHKMSSLYGLLNQAFTVHTAVLTESEERSQALRRDDAATWNRDVAQIREQALKQKLEVSEIQQLLEAKLRKEAEKDAAQAQNNLKVEKLLLILETKLRQDAEKDVERFQSELHEQQFQTLKKDLECRRAEAVAMTSKAREEIHAAYKNVAIAREERAEAREQATRLELEKERLLKKIQALETTNVSNPVDISSSDRHANSMVDSPMSHPTTAPLHQHGNSVDSVETSVADRSAIGDTTEEDAGRTDTDI